MSETRSKKQPLPLWRRIALVLVVLAIVGLGAQMLASYFIKTRLDSKVAAIQKAGYPVSFEQLAPLADAATTDIAASFKCILSCQNVSFITINYMILQHAIKKYHWY